MSEPGPTFTYWDEDDISPIREHIEHWQAAFPAHHVLTRQDARRILKELAPEKVQLFDSVRIPACRSDIARLLGLYVYGGLYVDSHCQIDDVERVHVLLERDMSTEIVVSTRWAPNFKKIMPYNGTIAAHKDSRIVRLLLDRALANASLKYSREREHGFEPYHVWGLTGPGVLWEELFVTERDDGVLQTPFLNCVALQFEDGHPVRRHVFMSYRNPGLHWSERQKSELLFAA